MKGDFAISTMTVADISEAVAIWSAAEYICIPEGEDYHAMIERYLKHNPGLSFIARDTESGEMIGTLLAGTDGMYGTLRHALVINEYRGRGIMTMLLKAVVEGFNQCKIKEIYLYVLERNQLGNEFFKGYGMQEVSGVKIFHMPV